jgi:hypothetical protein
MKVKTEDLKDGSGNVVGEEVNFYVEIGLLSFNFVLANGIKVNVTHINGGDLNISPVSGNLNGIRLGSPQLGVYVNIGQNRLELNGDVYRNGVPLT